MADRQRRAHLERVTELGDGPRHAPEGKDVTSEAVGHVGEGVAGQIGRNDAGMGCQRRQDLSPLVRGAGGAMQQEDDGPLTGVLDVPSHVLDGDEATVVVIGPRNWDI
jgi:hypothetical protein